jgi:twitching motility protein PilU
MPNDIRPQTTPAASPEASPMMTSQAPEKLMHRLFRLMSEKQASDIFVSAGTPIHIKINGVVMPINTQVMMPDSIKTLIFDVLTPDQIRTFETEKELNCSIALSGVGSFRVNVFWQRSSIGCVVRFIRLDIPTMQELQLPNVLSQVIMEKRGLVLVVGATGSGKSTSLASMIDYRNQRTPGHILTFEDPIEYLFKSKKSVINQREIGIDTHSFQVAMKNAMRQAPDCILVGEIRDIETMKMAMMYALSGHLCLATLHANNSYHALNRIINFFPLEQRAVLLGDLAVSLKCIISQRLVKSVDGGRMPTVEVLMNTQNIADLITEGRVRDIKEAMEQSLTPGSQTFEQDLFRLIKAGKISVEEAMLNADSATNLSLLVGNSGIAPVSKVADLPPRPGSGGPNFSEFKIG